MKLWPKCSAADVSVDWLSVAVRRVASDARVLETFVIEMGRA